VQVVARFDPPRARERFAQWRSEHEDAFARVPKAAVKIEAGRAAAGEYVRVSVEDQYAGRFASSFSSRGGDVGLAELVGATASAPVSAPRYLLWTAGIGVFAITLGLSLWLGAGGFLGLIAAWVSAGYASQFVELLVARPRRGREAVRMAVGLAVFAVVLSSARAHLVGDHDRLVRGPAVGRSPGHAG
jgi:hypothetical protein